MNNDNIDEDFVVGIDLGTTNSCVGIWRNNNLEIIPDEYGHRTIPSFIAYTNINKYVGQDAKNQLDLNPENVYYEIKRLIGRKSDDDIVKKEQKYLSYKISGDETINNNIRLVSSIQNNKLFTPEELQASILQKLKHMASSYLKKQITKAVITIPAYFNDGQRQATKDAATIAGLECVRMINEPTAAGLAYGLMKREHKNTDDGIDSSTILVYDFGGGTLDITLLSVQNGLFEVIASSGNTRLGGSDFETRLMSYCIAKFSKLNGNINIDGISCLSIQKLRIKCENAKKILSTHTKTTICVNDFHNNKDLFVTLTRHDLEQLCNDLFLMCLKPIDEILHECDICENDIDDIILVGGMTRMPKIRELIKNKFHKEPNCSINPEEAVTAGAAIQAYIISHQNDPFSEAVTLLDTTSLSLGIETNNGVMDILIPRGSIIPVEYSKEYTTDEDYVKSVTIKVFEGERALTSNNYFVGEFELCGIEPTPRGIPEINVTFSIDANGIIIVKAENNKTNDTTSLAITSNKGRLSKDDIMRLVEESKDFEYKDELEKRKKLLYYDVDDFCNNILVNLKRDEFKLTESDKQTIHDDVTNILLWLKQKKYNEYDDDEYLKVLDNMKKKYGVLMLKGNVNIDTNIQTMDTDTNIGISIYDDDIKNDYDNDENIIGMVDVDTAELKEIRKSLSDLCYSVFDMMSSRHLNMSEEHKNELKDYIDDALLWLHVHHEKNINDYKIKIDNINETCNKIVEHYKNVGVDIFKQNEVNAVIKTPRDELENTCIVLNLMIKDGAFPVNKKHLANLEEQIIKNLDWITHEDIKYVDNKTTYDVNEYQNHCEIKLKELSSLCDSLYQTMNGISLNTSNVMHNNKNNIDDSSSTTCGTSIMDIVMARQKEIFDDMIDAE